MLPPSPFLRFIPKTSYKLRVGVSNKIKRIYVYNVKLGHSTNSSSTHSILWSRKRPTQTKETTAQTREAIRKQAFGWSHFVLDTPEAKASYLGQILLEWARWGYVPDQKAAAKWAETLLHEYPVTGNAKVMPDGYIDHQSSGQISEMALRYSRMPGGKIVRGLEGIIDYLLQPEVIIVGGNDNESDEWKDDVIEDAENISGIFSSLLSSNARFRWDERDSYWSVFDSTTGNVLRYRREKGAPITRSEVPELVDLSIGNGCNRGCAYCYRGSTPSGGWAPANRVLHVFNEINRAEVFEVAIGGGEPFQHPQLKEILRGIPKFDLSRRGAGTPAVYITTRELDWMNDKEMLYLVKEKISGFGFSVDTCADLKYAREKFEQNGFSAFQINFQVVPEVIAPQELTKILSYAAGEGLRLTLLGYKTTGRGKLVEPNPINARTFLAQLKGLGLIGEEGRLGVDSVLAKSWEKELGEVAWPGSYQLQDGSFSCFVDALTQMVYKNSYTPRSEGYVLDRSGYDWGLKRSFRKLQEGEPT